VDILLPDRGLDGTPQVPSRFLLHAGGEEILPRVSSLLTGESAQRASVPSAFGDRLQLPEPEGPDRLSVTDFSAWLADPFRFFLERLMGWEVPLDREEEMDAMQFGSLLHVLFCHYNSGDEARKLSRENETVEFLLDTLRTESTARFGGHPPLAVRIQLEAMEQRLRAVAPHLAAQRRAGWRPLHAEWKIHDRETGRSRLTIEGLPLSGVVDLVERNEESGELRVLDYKTSDSTATPFKAHLGKVTAASGEPPLPEVDFDLCGKPFRWRDLQLPLYAAAVENEFGQCPRVGYVNLPKTVLGAGLVEWPEGGPPVEEALRCAGAVVRAVREGLFWPPSKGFASSDWQPWWGPVPEEAIAESWLRRHGREERA
jgi:ATP-dependent helicase/nuclease subunit B